MSPPQATSRCILKPARNLFDYRNRPMFFIEDVSPRTDLYDHCDFDLLADFLDVPRVNGWHSNSAVTSAPRNSLALRRFKPADVMTRCEVQIIASKQSAVISACSEVG